MQTIHVSGTVVEAVSGAPIGGALIEFAGKSVTADAGGGYAFDMTTSVDPALDVPVTVSHASYLTRKKTIAALGGHSGLLIDLIAEPLLDVYRQLARGMLTTGTAHQIIRWEQSPRLLIDTVFADTGATVPSGMIDAAQTLAIESVPIWSASQYSVASVETGTDPSRKSNYIVIVFSQGQISYGGQNYCGLGELASRGVTVPVNGPYAVVQLSADPGGCSNTGFSAPTPDMVRRQFGHVMGFWDHNDSRGVLGFRDIPSGQDFFTNANEGISSIERYVAQIVYSRPVGNTDIDNDPAAGFPTPTVMRVGGLLVAPTWK